MWKKTQETVEFLKEKGFVDMDYGIILGTGLGNFTNNIDISIRVAYEDIPNFPVSTVSGHHGELIYGSIGDKKVLALRGRFHYYEGWSLKEATFPVRVMKYLGIERIIVSNASGGVNPTYKTGDIMLISDHINMMPEHPLRGANDSRFGLRFVDMHDAYCKDMIAHMEKIASKHNEKLQKGIYLALQGPTFETPAEYRMVYRIGADAVGMSTVPEVIVAKHMDMQVFGISVITDLGIEGKVEEVSHEEVKKVAKKAERKVGLMVSEFIKTY